MRSFHVAGAALSLVLLTAPVTAWAQGADGDRATARTLGQAGQKALDAKDWTTAEDDFRRADSLVHAPTLLLGLARALAGEGKLVEAQEAYMRIVREGAAAGAPEVFLRAIDEAKQEVPAITPRIGGTTITVQATGGGAIANPTVTLDESPIGAASLGVRRSVDPGTHVVKVTADGYKTASVTITVPEGGTADASVSLDKDTSAPPPAPGAGEQAPAPASASGGRGIWPWVAFGVGGVGLGVGVVGGVLALSKHSSLSGPCAGGTCPLSSKDDLDSYHSMATISTVGFIVAGVGAAAGVTLLLLPRSDGPAPATGLRVTPVVGPGSLGAVGQF